MGRGLISSREPLLTRGLNGDEAGRCLGGEVTLGPSWVFCSGGGVTFVGDFDGILDLTSLLTGLFREVFEGDGFGEGVTGLDLDLSFDGTFGIESLVS